MFVAVPVSSRNTSFSMSSVGWFCFQACRASCTSGRSCSLACRVFFIAQSPFVQLMPQCWHFDGSSVLVGQSLAHLRQRQIRPLRDPCPQYLFQRCKRRYAMPSNRQTRSPAFRPKLFANLMHPAATDLKPCGYVRRALATLQGAQHPIPQILRICAHMLPLLWAETA